MADDGRINIRVALEDGVKQLQSLRRELESVDDRAKRSNRSLDSIRQVMGNANTSTRQTRDAVRELVRAYTDQTAALNRLLTAQNNMNNAANGAARSTSSLSSIVSRFIPAVLSLAGAWRLFTNTLSVAVEMDSLNKTFYAVQGSMTGAATEMDYLRKKSQELGLEFMALTQSYKGFSAAAKFANFDISTTRDMFNGVAEASTVLGLSGDKTKLVLMALEQMISKGTVSMEELRRQLGDSLPGAFELGAKAMGMGLAEFNKFVASGKLMSEDFLPKFTKTLRETFGPGLVEAIKTPRAQIERLRNELVFTRDTFAREGFLDTVKMGVQELAAALKQMRDDGTIGELARSFGDLVNLGLKVIKVGLQYADVIKSVVIAVGFFVGVVKGQNMLMSALAVLKAQDNILTKAMGVAYTYVNSAVSAFTTSLKVARVAAIALTGALTLGVGAIAALVIPEVISWFAGFGKEVSVADEFGRKFNMTLYEAELQISRFNKVAGGSDPLKPFRDNLQQITDEITKLNIEIDKTLEKAKRAPREIGTMIDQNALNAAMSASQWGGVMDLSDVIIPTETQSKINASLDLVEGRIEQTFDYIRKGSATSSSEVIGLMQDIQKLIKDQGLTTEQLGEYWSSVVRYSAIYANHLARQQQIVADQRWTEFGLDWVKNIGLASEELAQFRVMFGNENWGDDFKGVEDSLRSQVALAEKFWKNSEEGKAIAQAQTRAQIEGLEISLRLQHALLVEKVRQQKLDKESLLTSQSASVVELARLEIAALDAQVKGSEEALNALLAKLPAIRAQMEKEFAPKSSKSASGASRTDSWIVSMKDKVNDATTAMQQLQQEYLRLQATSAGLSDSVSIAQIFDAASVAIKKLDDDMDNFRNKLEALEQSTAPQKDKDEARNQLAALSLKNTELQSQIQMNAQLQAETALQQQSLAVTQARAKLYGEMFQFDMQRKLTIQALQQEIEMQQAAYDTAVLAASLLEAAMDTSGNATQEQILKLQSLRLEADLAATSIAGLNKKLEQQTPAAESVEATGTSIKDNIRASAEEAQNQFTDMVNAIPTKAVQGFAQSTVDAFNGIVSGSMSASEAFENFGKSMLTMIQDIISQLLVQLMVKTMLKAMGMADGGVVGGGIKAFANGGIVGGGGGRLIPLASGGVLTGPQLFGTRSGDTILAGEAGPEAFVPLGRTREGKLGIETTNGFGGGGSTMLVVNVFNNASDKVSTNQQQGTDENGNPRLDIFIDQIDTMLAGKVASGKSALGRSIDKTRGTSPAKALYV